jgi:hypothetical protein
MEGMKRLFFPVQKGETIGNIASCIITTNCVDRQNEVMDPDGADLTNYMTNPVVLYGHAYQGMESIPIGRAISMEIYHDGDKKGIKASWEWQDYDVSPLISAVRKSWERGFLNTASIGFMPNEYKETTVSKWEMLEYSVVPIPANPEALRINGFTDEEVKALTPEVTAETLIADLEAMVSTVSTKEGRVLSTKNRDLVQTCVSSLQALLDASDVSAAGAAQPEQEDWLTRLHKALIT